jgi:cyclophilin family peptidyl-prolyl cis-trans isomerase/HEAT repeat protein
MPVMSRADLVHRRGFALLGFTLVLAACAGSVAPPSVENAPTAAEPFFEERAVLLLMEDRRTADPVSIERFAGGAPALRERTAVALGRIGDPALRPTLEVLLLDAAPAVRRAAAFALGQLGLPASRRALLRAVTDADAETGGLAVEALAKGHATAKEVETALAGLPEEERSARLLPYLFRFKDPDAVRIATAALANLDAKAHALAAYALAREPQPAGLASLRLLLADHDPWVRDWAARGVGIVGDGSDVPRLRPLLDDPEPGPVIQALRAAKRLLGAGKGAAPADWRPRLRALFDDERPGVGVTALEVAGGWLRDEELGAALAARATDSGAPERQRDLALLALAEGKDPRAAALVERATHSPSVVERTRAAEAAARLGDRATLLRAFEDASPSVRAAALDALLQPPAAGQVADVADTEALARKALTDPDPIVRATALESVGAALSTSDLAQLLAKSAGDTLNDAQLSAVKALGAHAAKSDVAERAAAVGVLEKLAGEHRDVLVRRQAAQSLADLGEPRPAVGAASDRGLDTYRDVLRQTAGEHQVDLVTDRGTIRIRLFCADAPLTCQNFLQLAGQGYFDGLRFHRVVPDFVAQGGDPRGDGSGGPGYAIRDEINRHRYARGAVGMALSGPDTGGSQFFLTLQPQPHLDGGYTVFGEVVSGMEVADRLVQGDKIQRAEVAGAGTKPVR